MTTNQLEYQLFQLSGTARALGYNLDLPTLFVDSVYGNKQLISGYALIAWKK
jgi:hypothetical protein